VFRSLPVARDVYREDTLPAAADRYARDTITLGWEDRLRARGRRRSDGGVEFGTALGRGTVLRAGDCFVLDPIAAAIIVIERPEPVFVIEPRTGFEWGLFGYHIGNSHQPVMITDRELVCPDAPGMADVLEYHRIPFARAVRSFTPVGLAGDASHRHML
jgi:urease accessory protein